MKDFQEYLKQEIQTCVLMSEAGLIITLEEASKIVDFVDSYDRLKEAFERRLFDRELELTGLACSDKQIVAALNHLRREAGLLPEKGEQEG